MRLHSPNRRLWWAGVILGAAGIISHFISIPVLSGYVFWLLAIGWLLLVLGTWLRGL